MAEREVTLPVDSLDGAMEHLRRPFAAGAVKWKVQTILSSDRGLLVAYVDARIIMDRLDRVCGHNWHSELREFGTSGDILCSLTVFARTVQDVGKGGFAKASASDALKRAAVGHGIGRSLYAIPTRVLESSAKGDGTDAKGRPKLKRVQDRNNKTQLWITDAARAWLAQQYQAWLDAEGAKHYGTPLDHGNAAETIGDAAVEGIEDPGDPPELEAARNELWELYERKAPKGSDARKNLPPGRFKAQVEAASAAELDELQTRIEGLDG